MAAGLPGLPGAPLGVLLVPSCPFCPSCATLRRMSALASALLQWLGVLPQLLGLLDRHLALQERQVRAWERLADAAEAYCRLDPDYWAQVEVLRGTTTPEEVAAMAEAEVQTPDERQVSMEQLTEFQLLWWRERGDWLDGDRLVDTYEREYQAALGRKEAQEAREAQEA